MKQQLIPKGSGGMRQLGIPTVLDRFIQQALLQVLQPIFDPGFSSHSHGFRPGKRAHDTPNIFGELYADCMSNFELPSTFVARPADKPTVTDFDPHFVPFAFPISLHL